MGHMKEKMTVGRFFVYLFAILFAFVCLYPFLMVIGGSLMTNSEVVNEGFKVFPKEVTFASYKLLLGNGNLILNGYKITLFVTVVGTFCSIIVNGMMGYVLSRKRVAGRKFMNLYVLLTMLFNGGMVPWYLICTRYLHLKNNIFALILPSVVSAWYIFLIRNYFSGIPEEIYEAAKIDGAGEFMIFRKIYLKLATPVIATVVLFAALGYWNDWWLGLMLMDRTPDAASNNDVEYSVFADDVGTVVGGAGDACIGSWRWCKDGDGGRDNRTDYPSVSIHPEVLYERYYGWCS